MGHLVRLILVGSLIFSPNSALPAPAAASPASKAQTQEQWALAGIDLNLFQINRLLGQDERRAEFWGLKSDDQKFFESQMAKVASLRPYSVNRDGRKIVIRGHNEQETIEIRSLNPLKIAYKRKQFSENENLSFREVFNRVNGESGVSALPFWRLYFNFALNIEEAQALGGVAKLGIGLVVAAAVIVTSARLLQYQEAGKKVDRLCGLTDKKPVLAHLLGESFDDWSILNLSWRYDDLASSHRVLCDEFQKKQRDQEVNGEKLSETCPVFVKLEDCLTRLLDADSAKFEQLGIKVNRSFGQRPQITGLWPAALWLSVKFGKDSKQPNGASSSGNR